MVNVSVEQLLDYLKRRCEDDWLIGYDSYEFYHLTEKYYQQFQSEKPPHIFLVEKNYWKFLAIFIAAIAANCPIFLCNPDWQEQEWKQVISKQEGRHGGRDGGTSDGGRHGGTAPTIMIPTGGSSGKIRFAVHTWDTLCASVRGFYQYFGGNKVNSFCILPLYHVSGLMQFLRSFLTGGHCQILSYQDIKQKPDNLPKINQKYFISLVPTQLQFLLQSNPIWLAEFHTVLLGGAPAWPSLLEQAREFKIKLAPTYGMTETASQVVTLKPEDFVKGNNSSGQVLPHAKLILSEENEGVIAIKSESLFLGYYPLDYHQNNIFYTDDIGQFDEHNYLYILGRNSQKIITGGENVYPSEVEAAILETQLVKDVGVIGLPDAHWGEVVIAVYVPKTQDVTLEMIKAAMENKVSKYKIPKYWVAVDSLPRNQQGKLNYKKLQELVISSVQIAKVANINV